MKLFDQSRDGSNLIGLISYHNSSRIQVDLGISHLTYLNFWINLPTFGSTFQINLSNQLFESTFWINLRNQPFHWISGITDLWYVTYFDKRTYVEKYTPTYWGTYNSSG